MSNLEQTNFFANFDFTGNCCTSRGNSERSAALRSKQPISLVSRPRSSDANVLIKREQYSAPSTAVTKSSEKVLFSETEAVLSGASTPPAAYRDTQPIWTRQAHESVKQKEEAVNPFSSKYQQTAGASDHRRYAALFARDRSAYIEADLAIKSDRRLAIIAISAFPDLFAYAPYRIKNDVQIASKAVHALPINVAYVGNEVKSNPAFWEAVARSGGDARRP